MEDVKEDVMKKYVEYEMSELKRLCVLEPTSEMYIKYNVNIY